MAACATPPFAPACSCSLPKVGVLVAAAGGEIVRLGLKYKTRISHAIFEEGENVEGYACESVAWLQVSDYILVGYALLVLTCGKFVGL